MNNVDKQIAVSRWIEEMDQRAKQDTQARVESTPQVDLAGLSPSQALAAVFGRPEPRQPKSFDSGPRDQHDGKPHQVGLRLGELRDGIAPTAPPAGPGAAPAAAPPEPRDGAPPARLADVWEQLAAPAPAAVPASPSAAVRAVLASLPDDQRQALESVVAERMGGLAHLPGDASDYRRSLVLGHLSARLQDARRLDPQADAAAVIGSLLPVVPASDPPAE